MLRSSRDHEAELQKSVARQQSLHEHAEENLRQVSLNRGVEGEQNLRQEIAKMSKTLEAKTKEQMSKVQTTLEAMVETMIGKLREDVETSWQSHDGRFAQMNSKFVALTDSLESSRREEMLRLSRDHEAELQKSVARQQSLHERVEDTLRQVSLNRGVEGEQQIREDIA